MDVYAGALSQECVQFTRMLHQQCDFLFLKFLAKHASQSAYSCCQKFYHLLHACLVVSLFM